MSVDFYVEPSGSLVISGLVSKYGAGNVGQGPIGIANSALGVSGSRLALKQMRYAYPGLIREAQAARTSIPVPAQAGISDNSTLTLDDGVGFPAVVYEFDKDGSGLTVGDRLVDIQAAVTSADVAAALAAAIAAEAQAFESHIKIVGASAELRLLQVAPGGIPWSSHLFRTAGASGNTAIVASIPGEWPGLPAAFAGGTPGRAGVLYLPVVYKHRRLVPTNYWAKPAFLVPQV